MTIRGGLTSRAEQTPYKRTDDMNEQTTKPKILIVDDEKPLRDTLARWFSSSYDCLTAPDAAEALRLVGEHPDLALIITDFKMDPGDNGIELLKKAKALNPSLAGILLTAFGTVDLAVEAMRDCADDFFVKPVTDLKQFELRIAKALRTASLEREVATLKSQLDEKLESFTGKSPAMENVYRLIRKVAPTNATVLIEGPSGTGKELVAHALHNLSPRVNGPFIAVECASLPSSVLETELFGAVRGAYTGAIDRAGCFETANHGTIFLDEIGEITPEVQVKLLRVLETRTFQRVGETLDRRSDFRLVAATNRNLAALVAEGKFREDLYYRLNVIDIHLPALKDRPGDIALLVSRFLREFSAANGGVVKGIDAQAMKALEDYTWPGNVRQLRNVMEKMVVLAGSERLTLADVPVEITAAASATEPAAKATDVTPVPVPTAVPTVPSSGGTLADRERQQILAALEACSGNKTAAAQRLGISRRTLHRKLNAYAEANAALSS